MGFTFAVNQLKRGAKLSVQFVGRIPLHGQATALLRAVLSECGHDDVTTWLYGIENGVDVSAPLLRFREEVKDCSIMPNVERS